MYGKWPLAGLIGVLLLPVLASANEENSIEAIIGATFKVANPRSTATCFFVARPAGANASKPDLVLVTAGHVLEQMEGEECHLVLRSKRPDGTLERREVALKVRAGDKPLWTRHPGADVAVLSVHLPETESIPALDLDQLATAEAVAEGRVRIGDDVDVVCYPAQLESNSAGFPVLRRGLVASYPLAPVVDHPTILVDYPTFAGDSGAPVVLVHARSPGSTPAKPDRPLIVGLVIGQHRQTDKIVLPFEERTVHHPLGLAIVVQAQFIREAIDRLKD